MRPHEADESIDTPWRERLIVLGVGALVLLLAGLLVSRLWSPAPPKVVVMSTGTADGGYHAYALKYRQILARSGIELRLLPSSGAVQNLQRLRDRQDGVSLALVQGGLASGEGEAGVHSLGGMFFEPVWVFHRADLPLRDLAGLGGRRVAVGVPGSGTRRVAHALLDQALPPGAGAERVELGGLAAAKALRAGELDAVIFVAAPDAPAVQDQLRATGVRLLHFERAEAYSRRFPYLTPLQLPQGAVDLAGNIPASDTMLVAATASLLASDDIHPVIVDLVLAAAREVHGRGSMLWHAGSFPSDEAPEFTLSPDAERFYKSGPSALQRYLPFWAVVWIQRLVFLGLPLLAIGIPLMRYLPMLYRWGMRRRIYRWYGELVFIERAVREGGHDAEAQRHQLDAIEAQISRMRIPAAFASEAYTLKMHLQLVRSLLQGEAHPASVVLPGAGERQASSTTT